MIRLGLSLRLPGSTRPPADPREAAIWWATRAQIDPVAHAADEGFDRWYAADPAHAAAWEEIARPLAGIGAYAAFPELRAMRDAALDVARAGPHPARRGRAIGGALAAGLALGLVTLGTFQTPPPLSQARLEAPQRYATAIGERRDIRLSDGSRIALNTASTLEVAYTAGRRDVRLLGGQALFRVAQDPARPFVVTAGNRRITATGTAFDVRIDRGGKVRVLLVEGHVRVEPAKPTGLARLIPALDRETLDPGQQLAALATGSATPVVTAADVAQGTAWSRGQIVFRGDALAGAVAEVNRYSTTRLTLDDPSLGRLKVSGVFAARGSEDFVAALKALYPVEAERRGPTQVALRWRTGAGPAVDGADTAAPASRK